MYSAAFYEIDRTSLYNCFSLRLINLLIEGLIVILIVDCASWSIAFENKDSCKQSTLVCYSSISIVNGVLERHPLESKELGLFWSLQALHLPIIPYRVTVSVCVTDWSGQPQKFSLLARSPSIRNSRSVFFTHKNKRVALLLEQIMI